MKRHKNARRLQLPRHKEVRKRMRPKELPNLVELRRRICFKNRVLSLTREYAALHVRRDQQSR